MHGATGRPSTVAETPSNGSSAGPPTASSTWAAVVRGSGSTSIWRAHSEASVSNSTTIPEVVRAWAR